MEFNLLKKEFDANGLVVLPGLFSNDELDLHVKIVEAHVNYTTSRMIMVFVIVSVNYTKNIQN